MDSDASSWFRSMSSTFSFLFFGFTILFSIFALFLYVVRLRLWCSCEICRSYVTSSWRKDFANLCDWYSHLLRKSPTGTIHLHVLNNIITVNPENIEYMLKTNFENYPKGKPFSTVLGDLLGRGIFNIDGHPWKFQRKMASMELGSVSIRMFAFELITDDIRSRLIPLFSLIAGKEEVLDLQDVFRRFSFDNICKFSFGLDPGCLNLSQPMSKFATAFDTASKLSAERALEPTPIIWKLKRLLSIGSEKKLKEAISMVNELAYAIIEERKRTGFSTNKDLLSRFMASIDDHKYLRDIVISFLLAGRDTIASGLTSFFFLLSQHPEVESVIRQEIDSVMTSTPCDDLASFEQMRQMHYLNAAIHESLRLYPPVQFDSKFAQEDDVLPDGTFVRRGTRTTYHQYAMGRMDRIWGQDSQEFKPERWLKNGVFVPESLYNFTVFHAGFRVCLGKEMALVEMKSVAVAVVRRFSIRVADSKQVPRFSPGLTATVSGGLPVVIQEIKN